MDFLFDIGRVLLDFDFESSLSTLLPPETPDAQERLKVLLDKKDEFESGAIPMQEYIDWALEALGSPATHEEFIGAWRRIFTPNLPMWQTVERLAQHHHRMILFSNINPIHAPWIFDTYPIFQHFQGAVLSFETGSIKPHESIYRHAEEKYGLIPSQTIYIDDLPANIRTGQRLGFRSWQYDLNDHAAFERWLEAEMEK
jgi:glucose-1-phosphatase